jgi:hypothetical protein
MTVHAWPLPAGRPVDPPRSVVRPCDAGLALAVAHLETQLGTIEAYNRLVQAARALRHKIPEPQNPLYAVNVQG